MTPQGALAKALRDYERLPLKGDLKPDFLGEAAAILAALPEGWVLQEWPHEDWYDGPSEDVDAIFEAPAGKMSLSAALSTERLFAILQHDRWGPGFCISDLGEHDFDGCDHQETWLDFARRDIGFLERAGLTMGREMTKDSEKAAARNLARMVVGRG